VILHQLTRCLAFWQIKHADLRYINLYIPFSLSSILVVIIFFLPIQPLIFGNLGFTRSFISILSVLPGFFIAALAAVATFQKNELDHLMPDPAPVLSMRSNGEWEDCELTMRMFLSHMFAYLTAISFMALSIGIMAELVSPSLVYVVSLLPSYFFWVKNFMKFSYLLIYRDSSGSRIRG